MLHLRDDLTSRPQAAVTSIEIDIQERTAGNKRRLENFGFKVHSQSDEDGILAEIFARIGVTNRVFVEIGVESGIECNTLHLLDEGWSGLWMEGYPEYVDAIQKSAKAMLGSGQLKLAGAYVTADNVNTLIAGAGIEGEIDLFSLDIDSNDYHVLEALKVIRPRILVLEHNHSCPPPERYIMPRNDHYRWSPGNPDFGASLTSLTELATTKGYSLVGCGLYSPNSFHVRNDLVQDRFEGPFTPEHFWNPMNAEKIFSYPRKTAGISTSELGKLKSRLENRTAKCNELQARVSNLEDKVGKLQAQLRRKRRWVRGWMGRILHGD